ncbi:MAG: hypothetical protein RL328_1222 [Acidobacteriota bacterium]|jgi:hypothetical protein
MISILLLVVPASAQTQPASIQERIAQSRPGTRLRVTMRNHTQFEGKLLAAGDRSFVVQPEKYLLNKRPAPITVAYQDVQAFKLNPMRGWVKGVIVAGAVVGALAVAVMINCKTNRFEC